MDIFVEQIVKKAPNGKDTAKKILIVVGMCLISALLAFVMMFIPAFAGIAFLLLYYSAKNQLYYMRFSELKVFWERALEGGRKSFRMEELDARFFMDMQGGFYIPYLDALNQDLEIRDTLDN